MSWPGAGRRSLSSPMPVPPGPALPGRAESPETAGRDPPAPGVDAKALPESVWVFPPLKQDVPCPADPSCGSRRDTGCWGGVTGPSTAPRGRHRFGLRNSAAPTAALACLARRRRAFTIASLPSQPSCLHHKDKQAFGGFSEGGGSSGCTHSGESGYPGLRPAPW